MNSNLETIKDYFKDVSLNHKYVKSFKVGSNYNISEDSYTNYPLVFLELPYAISYDFKSKLDQLQFSFNVLLESKIDSAIDDHKAISDAKLIGDAILYYIYNDSNSPIAITSSNSITLREFSDDNVSGMRYDLIVSSINGDCDYTEMFY